jgi:hypothetical protein
MNRNGVNGWKSRYFFEGDSRAGEKPRLFAEGDRFLPKATSFPWSLVAKRPAVRSRYCSSV